ncbi:hypothetical protein HZB01_04735 [Candidatus Woesearchaeota archaeon]|nr:hypothetical protein [Candidatus Woesearchaeota archaeon]
MVLTEKNMENLLVIGFVLVGILVVVGQFQISAISSSLSSGTRSSGSSFSFFSSTGSVDLKSVDVTQITSTPMAVAAVFPELKDAKTEDDITTMMIPTGTPEYSEALGGISFDDPVTSMEYLAKWYPTIKQEVQKDPALWSRYLALAGAPRGISCEYCCGVGPQGIDKKGNLLCGCQHMPAVHAVTLGLMKNTDYNDAQILREVMRWKTTFFPKNMVGVALEVAGKDPSQLKELPGMVGGC